MKVERSTLRSIAKTFGLKVRFEDHGDRFAGAYSRKTKSIVINTRYHGVHGIAYDLSTFFHEVAHQHCNDMGMWSNFYNYASHRKNTLYKKIALKAEKDTDRVGKELMNLYFPHLKYEDWYLSIDGDKWKRQWWNDYLKSF